MVVLEGNPVYYGRFGFEHSRRYGIELPIPSWAPPEASQIMRLSAYDPSMRGKVVYPPAFDDVAEH
jgi:putative acetyltransferase